MKQFALLVALIMVASCSKNDASRLGQTMTASGPATYTPCSQQGVGGLYLDTASGPTTVWLFEPSSNASVRYTSAIAEPPTREQVVALWQKAYSNDPSMRQGMEAMAGFAAPIRTYTDATGNKIAVMSYQANSMLTPEMAQIPGMAEVMGQKTTLALQAETQPSDLFLCNMSYYPSADRHYLVFSGMKMREARYHMRRISQ